jgi:hypothetical protein
MDAGKNFTKPCAINLGFRYQRSNPPFGHRWRQTAAKHSPTLRLPVRNADASSVGFYPL